MTTECCICGKALPNRYGLAGGCEEPCCDAVFCALHWNRGNRRCRKHGYKENEPLQEDTAMSDNATKGKPGHAGNAKRAMHGALGMMRKVGQGTTALIKKVRKDRSPAAMIAAIDAQLEQTAARKDQAAAEVEALHGRIMAKKAEFKSASKARQEILEAELKSLLISYNAAKRTYKILLENEQHMSLVKGRLGEVGAYGTTPVSESLIDDVIESLETAADEAEGVADAARDLEKAGKRREREDDKESLWDALAMFEEDGPEDRVPEASTAPVEPAGAVEEKKPLAGLQSDDV